MLINHTQENVAECKCGFVVPSEKGIAVKNLLGVPCPKCSTVLVTAEEYRSYIKTIKIINFINKWFGWLSIFKGREQKARITFRNND